MTGDLCGAKTRRGTLCRRPAGWGTSHPGAGNCKLHTGATPAGDTHAARVVGRALAEDMGGDLEVDPLDALLWSLGTTYTWARWIRSQVENLDDSDLYGPVGGSEHGDPRQEPHVWVREYGLERDRVAKIAKLCLDAGVAERQVQIIEQMGEALAAFAAGLLEDFGLTGDPRAPAIVRKRLAAIEGTARTVSSP